MYRFIVLPRTSLHLPTIIEKYRIFRLSYTQDECFQADPSDEAHYGLSFWWDYLKNPRRFVAIALAIDRDAMLHTFSDDYLLATQQWVGILHWFGPVPKSDWTVSGTEEEAGDDHLEAKWHNYSAYVCPEHRGCQPPLLKSLAHISLQYQKERTLSLAQSQDTTQALARFKFRLRFMVAECNKSTAEALVRLFDYKRTGRTQRSSYAKLTRVAPTKHSKSQEQDDDYAIVLEKTGWFQMPGESAGNVPPPSRL